MFKIIVYMLFGLVILSRVLHLGLMFLKAIFEIATNLSNKVYLRYIN